MEENNRQQEIKEICFIYHKRNLLGRERDRLRHKYRYLQDIKRALQVRDNFECSDLYKKMKRSFLQSGRHVSRIEDDKFTVDLSTARTNYLKENPIPKRFEKMKLSHINMLILEADAKVCQIKVKIMKHTHKYDKKLKSYSTHHSPRYVCGIVRTLSFDSGDFTVNESDMKRYHDEALADKAVDKMLRG